MADKPKTEQAPKDLMGFLDYWLVKKAPFQLPENAKEWIVKYGPWIDLVLLVILGFIAVPTLLAALGFSAALSAYVPGYALVYGPLYWAGILVLVFQVVLQAMALPGLFARKMSGWTLLFYSEIVSFVYSLVTGQIVGAFIGALIGLYFLFQIRAKYTK